VQYHRVREYHVARLPSHFNDTYFNSVDRRPVPHESLNPILCLPPRAERLHPRVRADQALPSLRGRKIFTFAYLISDESMRTGHKETLQKVRVVVGDEL
jgi:hypothetical protein